MLAWLFSAAARYRNQVASGTRKANSGATLPISRTIALKPPACSNRSVTRSACSMRDQGLPERTDLPVYPGCGCAMASMTYGRISTLVVGAARTSPVADGCKNLATASESPLTSFRGCPPQPPPCKPFKAGGGTRYFSGRAKLSADGCGSFRDAGTPHRIQRSLGRWTPAAAADSG